MQIIQHRKHIDKISLQQIWCALQFINSLSFPLLWSGDWTDVSRCTGWREIRASADKGAGPEHRLRWKTGGSAGAVSEWRRAALPARWSSRRTGDQRKTYVAVRYLLGDAAWGRRAEDSWMQGKQQSAERFQQRHCSKQQQWSCFAHCSRQQQNVSLPGLSAASESSGSHLRRCISARTERIESHSLCSTVKYIHWSFTFQP